LELHASEPDAIADLPAIAQTRVFGLPTGAPDALQPQPLKVEEPRPGRWRGRCGRRREARLEVRARDERRGRRRQEDGG
jgi:hypothetical protein